MYMSKCRCRVVSPPLSLAITLLTILFVTTDCNGEAGGIVYKGGFDTYVRDNLLQSGDSALSTTAVKGDEPRINLAYGGLTYEGPSARARFVLQGGDSVNINYQGERHREIKHFQESSAGLKLTDDIWLDGGVFFSHLGLENFISHENWTYTRSLVADFSPYYQAGARLTYQASTDTSMELHLLRGWQNVTNSERPAFGGLFSHAVTKELQLKYANFIGKVDSDSLRVYHDTTCMFSINDQWKLAGELDYGQEGAGFLGSQSWWGTSLLLRYEVAHPLSMTGRVEYFSDPHAKVLTTPSSNPFRGYASSLTVDYEFGPLMTTHSRFLWRNEIRLISGSRRAFIDNRDIERTQGIFVSALSWKF
jgi:Putative beta-barrel porin-2, OmpL-like. bbp2